MTGKNSRASRQIPEPAVEYLLVKAATHEFALRMEKVHSITTGPDILAIPNSEAWLVGMLVLPDRAVSAIDLRLRLGLQPHRPPQFAITVDLAPHLALLVDKILDKAAIRPKDIRPLRSVTRPFHSFLTGSWHGRSRVVYLLDLGSLLAGCSGAVRSRLEN